MTHATQTTQQAGSLDADGGFEVDSESGLWLIGIGTGDLNQMTVAAQEAAKSAEYRFLEGYTAILPEKQEKKLGEIVGEWQKVMRGDVENPEKILTLAETSKVALMIVGDPLQATTHVDLQLRAEERGIGCKVIHGVSVTTIVTGAIGLQSYRFGRQVTLVYPYGDYLPTSPLELLLKNREQELHTLVLFDLDPTGMGEGEQQPMSPATAVDVLNQMAILLDEDIANWMVVLCSDMGTEQERIVYGNLPTIAQLDGGLIHCMVVTGRVDEIEAKALDRWRL